MAENQPDKPTPPYLSYATYKTFLGTLKQAIPGRIDKTVMTMLSGANQTQLLHALKYLKLIDGNGAPQEKLALLVNSEGADRQKVQQDILRAAYPFLNDASFKLESATTGQLDEQFAKLPIERETLCRILAAEFFDADLHEIGIRPTLARQSDLHDAQLGELQLLVE